MASAERSANCAIFCCRPESCLRSRSRASPSRMLVRPSSRSCVSFVSSFIVATASEWRQQLARDSEPYHCCRRHATFTPYLKVVAETESIKAYARSALVGAA